MADKDKTHRLDFQEERLVVAGLEKEGLTFEEAMEHIEQLVRVMEAGNATLDEMLESFAKGVKLAHYCQEYLDAAEKHIERIISTTEGTIERRPLHTEGSEQYE